MRILHLTWEYPPVMYGGLGRHVHALANAQAANGHEVVVITQAPNSAAPARVPWGSTGAVRVLRATIDPSTHDPRDLLAHVAEMECEFTGHGNALLADWQPDVIHAHDWMVAHAAVALRGRCRAPLTATIHATEAGRNRGWVTTDLSTAIHGIEWWLANTADAVITCSRTMRDEVRTLFGIGSSYVVPNGIEPAEWRRPEFETARISAENADAHPLIAYTGRVEWEKGVQTLHLGDARPAPGASGHPAAGRRTRQLPRRRAAPGRDTSGWTDRFGSWAGSARRTCAPSWRLPILWSPRACTSRSA